MNWQDQLITIYLFVCKHFQSELWAYSQRMTNYADLRFTDEEVITLFLFGTIDKRWELKQIYTYADRHLRPWFPNLPGYVGFVQRVNRVADVFAPLIEAIQRESGDQLSRGAWATDSFPVALAKQGHRFNACVAEELADAGYCSTKKLYFYGVRVHVVARLRPGALPFPEFMGVTQASHHDGIVFDQIRPVLTHNVRYADKAYQRPDAKQIETEQNLVVFTPVKKQKGQAYLDAADQWLSTAISRARQPIEALFAWIEEKTGIQRASKVRSYRGLLVHVFGRLAAALLGWTILGLRS